MKDNILGRNDGIPYKHPPDPERLLGPECYWVEMTLLWIAGDRAGELSTFKYPESSFWDWTMIQVSELLGIKV